MKQFTAKAKSPKGVANEIRSQLIATYHLNPMYVFVWSPEESQSRGYSKCWSVCAEEGPFEWAPNLTGNNINIYNHESVFCEAYNGFIVSLYKQASAQHEQHEDTGRDNWRIDGRSD